MQLSFDEMFQDQIFGPRNGLFPRNFQLELTESYITSALDWTGTKPHVYCVHAGTGSGKTKGAGLIASAMLNNGKVDQVVIVVPNRSILRKTRSEFSRYFGIDVALFRPKWHGSGIPRMQQGYILTYAALMSNPSLHRKLCHGTKTLVIFDEIHHLGDKNGWGTCAEEAFGSVSHILALTGTPYRHDNTRIPFVRYGETHQNGILKFKPDFPYPLGQAVADGVCRNPLFLFHGGKCRMRMGPHSGELITDFSDHNVSEIIAAERLRGAVRYGSTDRHAMLKQALTRCKEEGRKVIVFLGGDTGGDDTPTRDATEFLPEELRRLGYTENEYEVVTGEDDQAQSKIESFGQHDTKWILVSINMISEGTDIPELSAAIFLTSITAKQTTVQRIGRVLRLMEMDRHKDALVFMFADKNLVELAGEINSEIEIEVKLRAKREPRPQSEGEPARHYRPESIGIGDGLLEMVKFQGQEWPAAVIEEARRGLKARQLPATMLQAVLTLFYSKPEGGAK